MILKDSSVVLKCLKINHLISMVIIRYRSGSPVLSAEY